MTTTLPFACAGSLADLDRRRVTQCALSRVCGSCGASLGRPVAFAGTEDEVARNAFHFPPLHEGCARDLVARAAGEGLAWTVVATSGFEYVRPGREDTDPRPTFRPNSLLGPG